MFKLFTNAYLNAPKIFVKSPTQINAMPYLFRSIMKTEKSIRKELLLKSDWCWYRVNCVFYSYSFRKKRCPYLSVLACSVALVPGNGKDSQGSYNLSSILCTMTQCKIIIVGLDFNLFDDI